MKKKDIYFLIICVILVGFSYFGYQYFASSALHNQPDGPKAYVYFQNKEVMSFDIDKDGMYDLEGEYGHFHIEVKEGKYRATNVECPNQTCVEVGWVKKGETEQIVCVPNNIFIVQK